MVTNVLHVKLLVKEYDLLGYQTLVFKNLDNNSFGKSYIMSVVFPNWESYIPEVGEIGYFMYDIVEAGVDTFYNRETDSIMKYNFNNIIFKKFIKEKDNSKKDIII